MITSQEIYSEAISNYIENFKYNKSKFNMVIIPTKDTPVLPNEAYTVDKLIYACFDFGAEETWTADQIEIKDNRFKCVLVYKGVEGWNEYWINVPVLNIVAISKPDIIRNITFNITKEDKKLQVKVNNSKKTFKYLSGKEL